MPELEGEGGNPGISSAVQAAVPMSPPTDFVVDWFEDSAFPPHDVALSAASALFGGLNPEDPVDRELARLASPRHHASTGDPPMLVVHGTLDDLVPVSQGRMLVETSLDRGAEASLLELPHDDHSLASVFGQTFDDPNAPTTPAMEEIIDFFERTLGPAGAA
jgi:acetyl esterase/lipase